MISSAEFRYGAVVYLSKAMPKWTNEDDEFSVIMKPDPGIMIKAIRSGLEDNNNLVKRGCLELLVRNIPLSAPFLQWYAL